MSTMLPLVMWTPAEDRKGRGAGRRKGQIPFFGHGPVDLSRESLIYLQMGYVTGGDPPALSGPQFPHL